MDFKYCYEKNGYKNDVEKLSNDWKAYLAGYLAAIEHLRNACYCFTDHKSIDDELPTLSKIENEFFQTNLKYLLHLVKLDYYQEVIDIMDNHWNEEKQCFENLEWGTPAAPDDDDDDDDID